MCVRIVDRLALDCLKIRIETEKKKDKVLAESGTQKVRNLFEVSSSRTTDTTYKNILLACIDL